MTEILKQDQYVPMSVEQQTAIIYAGTSGLLDDIPTDRIRDFETQFLKFLEATCPDILKGIKEKRELTPELEEKLKTAVNDFKKIFATA
jgi:F-type H+-transporting ATPase subunit alpha